MGAFPWRRDVSFSEMRVNGGIYAVTFKLDRDAVVVYLGQTCSMLGWFLVRVKGMIYSHLDPPSRKIGFAFVV